MKDILMNIDRACMELIDREELSEEERDTLKRASLCALMARLSDSQGDDAGAREMMAELLSMRAKLQSTSERLRLLSISIRAVDFLIYSLVKNPHREVAAPCDKESSSDEEASCAT